VHDTAATRADQAGGFDNLFDARQIGGQVTDGAFWCRLGGRPITCLCGPFLLFRLDLGQRDGQVLEGQLPLVLGQLF
jgi:hypothetical protein